MGFGFRVYALATRTQPDEVSRFAFVLLPGVLRQPGLAAREEGKQQTENT